MYELFNVLERHGIARPDDLLKVGTLSAKKLRSSTTTFSTISTIHRTIGFGASPLLQPTHSRFTPVRRFEELPAVAL